MFGGGLHPGLEGDAAEPVLDTGDEARKILTDMLFGDEPDRNLFAGGHCDGGAEFLFAPKDPQAVMPQGPVSEISQIGFGLVEPVVDGLVVCRGPTEAFGRALRMVKRMSDDLNSCGSHGNHVCVQPLFEQRLYG